MQQGLALAKRLWAGQAPTATLDCELFLSVANKNLNRDAGRHPELLKHAQKNGVTVKPRASKPATKSWKELGLTMVRRAVADGIDDTAILAFVSKSIEECRKSPSASAAESMTDSDDDSTLDVESLLNEPSPNEDSEPDTMEAASGLNPEQLALVARFIGELRKSA